MPLSRPITLLLLALGAMFVQQTFASIGRTLPPIIGPAIVDDLGLNEAWIGVYVSIAAAGALAFQLGCGSFILRYGALRMSQLALAFLAIGLAAAAAGPISFFIISALIGGGGAAMSTPASSHLLGRYSPPKYAPLVFSIKQTAVPAGLVLAGLLGPLMAYYWGWRGALVAAGLACLAFAFMLEPLRREFDSDRVPSQRFAMSDFVTTITAVLKTSELRNLSIACFAFNGLQTAFTSFFVAALVSLGYSLGEAGALFSLAMAVAVPMRILWGWISSGWVSPRVMMAALSLGMAASAFAMGFLGPHWPVLLLGTVATALSATAMSWHGVLLAEAARLAPPGRRGAATGGVLSFGQMGALSMPLVYGFQLPFTQSHGLGFVLCGIPALAVGILLLRPEEPRKGGKGGL